MARYTVGITGRLYVIAEFDVEAENPKEAERLAMLQAFQSDHEPWVHYTSVPDSKTLQVENVTRAESPNVYTRHPHRDS